MSTPTQITITGALGKEHVAALVSIACDAGAALLVQPRAIAAAPDDVVVDQAPRRKALPSARKSAGRASGAKVARQPVGDDVLDRVRRALREAPLSPHAFQLAARVSVHQARQMVASGVIVATGVTHGRRYALPGSRPAKEAP